MKYKENVVHFCQKKKEKRKKENVVYAWDPLLLKDPLDDVYPIYLFFNFVNFYLF